MNAHTVILNSIFVHGMNFRFRQLEYKRMGIEINDYAEYKNQRIEEAIKWHLKVIGRQPVALEFVLNGEFDKGMAEADQQTMVYDLLT